MASLNGFPSVLLQAAGMPRGSGAYWSALLRCLT